MVTSTSTRTGCSYPMNKPSTGYTKGCRCTGCKSWRTEHDARKYVRHGAKQLAKKNAFHATPEGRAKKTLAASRTHAKQDGYAPVNATWREVMELQQSTTRCQACNCTPDHTLHTDHCHETGTLRGMLCSSCNIKDVLNGI